MSPQVLQDHFPSDKNHLFQELHPGMATPGPRTAINQDGCSIATVVRPGSDPLREHFPLPFRKSGFELGLAIEGAGPLTLRLTHLGWGFCSGCTGLVISSETMYCRVKFGYSKE